MDSAAWEAMSIGAWLTAVSAAVVVRRFRAGTLLTAAGGLHVNVLLFFGLGAMAYATGVAPAERIGDVIPAMASGLWYFGPAYTAVAFRELWRSRRSAPHRAARLQLPPVSDRQLLGFGLLALVGYVGSQSDLSSSGAGTIFPVLKLFWYPVLVAAVSRATRRNPRSLFLLVLALLITVSLSYLSAWRSEMINTGGAVLLGLLLRNRRFVLVAPALAGVILGALLPFAHLKKTNYEQVMADPWGTAEEVASMPLEDRAEFVAWFWAVRISGARELAFAVDGLESGRVALRSGVTYVEAVLQLVPRVVWPGKPSYNTTTAFYLARDLGLLGWEDDATSAGVNLYAEAVWNFGRAFLLLFVPLVFLLAERLDALVPRWIRDEGIRWLVSAALFFYCMAIVGFVSAMTYFVWSVLVGKAAEKLGRAYRPGHKSPATLTA